MDKPIVPAPMAPKADPMSPTVPRSNTARSFSNMVNENTGLRNKKKMLSSVSDVLMNTNLSRIRKVIALKARGFSMKEAEDLVDGLTPTEQPEDIFMDSARPKMTQVQSKPKKSKAMKY